MKVAPVHAPSSTCRLNTIATSSTRTRGDFDARVHSTRPISRPVASRACSTRRTLWAASRPSAGAPVLVAGIASYVIALGEHKHVAHLGERDRGTKAGDGAVDDEEVGGHSHGA